MTGVSRPFESMSGFTLTPGEVHVWHADLAMSEEYAGRCVGVLDRQERARAARLRVTGDRAQFIVAHAIARILLGQYLGYGAPVVRLATTSNGKPYLAGEPVASALRFNASRTKDYAAFAFASGREVGIDIERTEMQNLGPKLYERALTRDECERIRAIRTQAGRVRAFYEYWVRKEAVLKARGDGLAVSPAEIATPAETGLVTFPDEAARVWRYEGLALAPDCTSAVAAEGSDWRVSSQRVFAVGTDQFA